MITLFLAAIGGLIFANIIIYTEDRRYKKKIKRRQERKKLGKKWYDD